MQRLLLAFNAALLCLIAPVGLAAQEEPQDTSREVNINAGSTAGWIPSEELEAEAIETFRQYYAHLEAGELAEAHALFGDGLQALTPFSDYEAHHRDAEANFGDEIERQLTKITWSKDIAGAPKPGIFAALDMQALFSNVDRHCGYVILYQEPGESGFTIARVQESILDNTAAESILEAHGALQLELIWRTIARACPDYSPAPLPDTLSEGIEFSTVETARAALLAREGVLVETERGWTIAIDEANLAIWSFAPESTAMYPAVIKRAVTATGPDTSEASMSMLCDGDQAACDDLFFQMAFQNGFIPVSLE